MATLTFEIIDWRGLNQSARVLPRAAAQFVAAWSMKFLDGARKCVPKGIKHIHPKSKRLKQGKSSTLSGSMQRIAFRRDGLLSYAVVGPVAQHAKWWVGGTKPHAIEARRAKWLTIWAPNAPDADDYGFVFRKRVNHPGTRKHDWITLARRLVVPWQQQLWERALKQSLVRAA